MSACRLLASCAPYGFVEVTAARSPRPSGFIGLLVCHFFLIYPCLLFFSSFASSSCTSVPPSVVSKCMLEKCLFACCKTCFDKYQLQVNDTVYEHWRFFLPFSFHEGGRTNETSSFFLIFFPYIYIAWLHSLPIKDCFKLHALIVPYLRLLRQMWQQPVPVVGLCP